MTACCVARLSVGTQVEIDRHVLHGSGRRIVEREVIEFRARFSDAPVPHLVGNALRLCADLRDPAGARRWRSDVLAVLAVVDVAEIGFDFAREEEFVRGREEGQRSAVRLRESPADCAPAAPPGPGSPSPPKAYCCQPRAVSRQTTRVSSSIAKPFSPPTYLYATDGSLVLAIGFLPQQVRRRDIRCTASEPEKMPAFTPGKRHLDARAVGLHLAAGRRDISPRPCGSPPACAADPMFVPGAREPSAAHPRTHSISRARSLRA